MMVTVGIILIVACAAVLLLLVTQSRPAPLREWSAATCASAPVLRTSADKHPGGTDDDALCRPIRPLP